MTLRRAVRTYLDHLAVERGLAANTLSSYTRDLGRYDEFLAGQGIDDLDAVTEATVSAFLVSLREGSQAHPPLSATSAARTVVAVRGFHKFAVSDGLAVADPAAGARISEAVGLDIDDLDQVDGTVLLRGKGGKERLVPVGGYARDAVAAYLARARPDLVGAGRGGPAMFLNSRGGRLSRQSAWAVLVKAAERAGVTASVSPHTLRHSFATHLLDGGADVRVVQELLGHASVTTTQVYTLVTVDNLREVFATAHPRARE